ncbi:MAG: hypothetical protein AAGK14_13810 [Verrucomicrobiota bacterium]
MSADTQGSGRANLFVACALLVVAVLAWEYFDVEQKVFGYPISDYFFQKLSETVAAIPALVDAMLQKLRSL